MEYNNDRRLPGHSLEKQRSMKDQAKQETLKILKDYFGTVDISDEQILASDVGKQVYAQRLEQGIDAEVSSSTDKNLKKVDARLKGGVANQEYEQMKVAEAARTDYKGSQEKVMRDAIAPRAIAEAEARLGPDAIAQAGDEAYSEAMDKGLSEPEVMKARADAENAARVRVEAQGGRPLSEQQKAAAVDAVYNEISVKAEATAKAAVLEAAESSQ